MERSKSVGKRCAVCVFCGSSPGSNAIYAATARRLGELIGRNGYSLVYGGGATGLMGEVARSALASGAAVIGIRPTLLNHLEPPEANIDMRYVPDLFERKRQMIAGSDAFIVLPGGMGTLDELFEVVTTAQLDVHDKRIVVVNTNGYFAPFFTLIRHLQEAGFLYRDPMGLFHVVEDADQAITFL